MSVVTFDVESCVRMSSEQLAQLTNLELLQVVRTLESCRGSERDMEHDHGRHLSRAELERLVVLAQRFWSRKS
ncbi:MAG: hypothetical protein AB7F89_09465 [Pirellulaceae bacterium]